MNWIKIFENYQEAQKIIPEGAIKKVRIMDRKMCLAMQRNKLFAFEANCPHMDYPLEESSINPQMEIVCPWHSYRFSLLSGGEASSRSRDLAVFPIVKREDGIYIRL